MNATPMLSVNDLARRLAIHPETVRRWIRDGTLTAAKLGRAWRISEADLAAFLGSADRARELMRGAE